MSHQTIAVPIRALEPDVVVVDYTPMREWGVDLRNVCGNVDDVSRETFLSRNSVACSNDCGGFMFPEQVVDVRQRLLVESRSS